MIDYGADVSQRVGLGVSQFDALASSIYRQLHVCLPGVVQSFDAAKQVVSVEIALNQSVVLDGQTKNVAFPILQNVPVVMPRAGGFTLTLPITDGDECLVFFSDLAIDGWQYSGGTQNNPVSARTHNLSDAFCVPGVWSQPRVLSNYSTSSMQLRSDDGQTLIDVADGAITVTAQTVTVNSSDATVNASNSATVKASGTATVQGQTVNVDGAGGVNINGSQNTVIDGRNFLLHTHKGVQSGPGISGPVL